MLRLEFWLPLPLIGLAFWIATGLLTEHNLRLPSQAVESFTIDPDRDRPVNQILSIKVQVNRDRKISQVKVKQATQVYQKQEFELATTEIAKVETAISQKLNLPPDKVRQLLRYQIQK